MEFFLVQLNILVVVCACIITINSFCEVRVPGWSWPTPYVLVPVNSTVLINCTTNQSLPYWSINLEAADVVSRSFTNIGGQTMFLNRRGLYDLTQVNDDSEISTLSLLINNTEVNNQTVVNCVAGDTPIFKTTLFVYEPPLLMLEATDTKKLQSSNISWGSLPSLVYSQPKQMYILSVKNNSTQQGPFQLYEPYHLFTASEGAPPCEIYNFAITATYVGATYTGAGCSVPSPVLSTMLPSLPNISLFESSLDFMLTKQENNLALYILFEPVTVKIIR